jgi:hypothetical protein
MKFSLHKSQTSIFTIFALMILSQSTFAAAKKAPKEETSTIPTSPLKQVELKSVKTMDFELPNGNQVNLQFDLDAMLRTAVTQSPAMMPSDNGESFERPACDNHLELRSSLSTLELNIIEAGITFGYTPTDALESPITVDASVDVKIGTIAMDFSLWDCVGTHCVAVAATTVDHRQSQITGSMTINFGEITTGPSLVVNTALGAAFRKIISKGIANLIQSARFNSLNWQATIREVNKDGRSFYIDAGQEQGVFPNQSFSVFTQENSTGSCNVYKVIAYAKSTISENVSSLLQVDTKVQPVEIRAGDTVMVRLNK